MPIYTLITISQYEYLSVMLKRNDTWMHKKDVSIDTLRESRRIKNKKENKMEKQGREREER